MALFVNTNVSGLSAQKSLSEVTSRLNASFEKLSSGNRINSARDDAAGLRISDRLSTQLTGLNQATRNANDGIAIAQIAEGALGEVTSNVQRMRQLVVQGGNSALSADDRSALAEEFEKLINVNESIAERTAFGDKKLLNGDGPEAGFSITTGSSSGQRDTITTGNATLAGLFEGISEDDANVVATLALNAMTETNLQSFGAIGDLVAAFQAVTSHSTASAVELIFGSLASATTLQDLGTSTKVSMDFSKIADAMSAEGKSIAAGVDSVVWGNLLSVSEFNSFLVDAGVATAVDTVTQVFTADQKRVIRDFATDKLMDVMSDVVSRIGSMRSTLGAEQNGMSSVIRSNQAAIVNVSDARSRILNTDFAAETAELTRNQIIQQASNTILAQANQLPQAALSLLR